MNEIDRHSANDSAMQSDEATQSKIQFKAKFNALY
jgi:hypothetical protein